MGQQASERAGGRARARAWNSDDTEAQIADTSATSFSTSLTFMAPPRPPNADAAAADTACAFRPRTAAGPMPQWETQCEPYSTLRPPGPTSPTCRWPLPTAGGGDSRCRYGLGRTTR
eukprot:362638-Chlamydomonas_euryale.AAC.2